MVATLLGSFIYTEARNLCPWFQEGGINEGPQRSMDLKASGYMIQAFLFDDRCLHAQGTGDTVVLGVLGHIL